MKNWFYILGIWAVIAYSCDPCNDCGEPLAYEPTVAIKFINQDSLVALNELLVYSDSLINGNDSIVDYYEDQLIILQDSIDRLNDSIDAGITGYEDALFSVTEMYEAAEFELEPLIKREKDLDSLVALYRSNQKTINSGLLEVNKVTLLTNGSEITYEDSSTLYHFPLLFADAETYQTDYLVEIEGKSFTFSLKYNFEETLNSARVYRIKATNIEYLENYTCDTLIVSCKNDICISNETTITAIY